MNRIIRGDLRALAHPPESGVPRLRGANRGVNPEAEEGL